MSLWPLGTESETLQQLKTSTMRSLIIVTIVKDNVTYYAMRSLTIVHYRVHKKWNIITSISAGHNKVKLKVG